MTSSREPEWWSWFPRTATIGTARGAARVREHRGLLGQPVRRQVAGEQDEVDSLRERGERPFEALAQRLGRVDVSCRGDANRRRHVGAIPAAERSANAERGYTPGHALGSPEGDRPSSSRR